MYTSKLKIKTSSVNVWRNLCWWPGLTYCLVTSSISQGRPQKKPADRNWRFGFTLAMHYRFSDVSTFGLIDLRNGSEHPFYAALCQFHCFPWFSCPLKHHRFHHCSLLDFVLINPAVNCCTSRSVCWRTLCITGCFLLLMSRYRRGGKICNWILLWCLPRVGSGHPSSPPVSYTHLTLPTNREV